MQAVSSGAGTSRGRLLSPSNSSTRARSRTPPRSRSPYRSGEVDREQNGLVKPAACAAVFAASMVSEQAELWPEPGPAATYSRLAACHILYQQLHTSFAYSTHKSAFCGLKDLIRPGKYQIHMHTELLGVIQLTLVFLCAVRRRVGRMTCQCWSHGCMLSSSVTVAQTSTQGVLLTKQSNPATSRSPAAARRQRCVWWL